MVNSESIQVGEPSTAIRDFADANLHLRWELQQVMARVRPDDLSAVEIAGLLAILIPAHSRVIGGGPAPRPALRILEAPGERPPNLNQ
jgi:hypothetical protein